jgi:hypothetical protein
MHWRNFHNTGGGKMPNNAEIISRAIDDFTKVQKRMLLAREENAVRTYADLKDDYVSLKVLLTSLGVNLTAIDKIKE